MIMPRRILQALFLVLFISLTTACGHGDPDNNPPPAKMASRAADQALAMVGKPYHYGGNTPAGFDCSGLVQYSYRRVGFDLPHGTSQLRRVSQVIPRQHLQRGDLLFFNQEGKKSSHVALYLGDDRFVHAPSGGKKVYVSSFNDTYWQKHFSEARRLDVD
ncbi:MAG: C40 family peptidase [Gammaproteobacteria bacterium]|nr:C40 family peptidase [Gammaproteobacteria bacterium]